SECSRTDLCCTSHDNLKRGKEQQVFRRGGRECFRCSETGVLVFVHLDLKHPGSTILPDVKDSRKPVVPNSSGVSEWEAVQASVL
ncbi:hypothetical protein BaRGS_00013627, partial [Batillaria attramentaria]